jgi:hypothetical protein
MAYSPFSRRCISAATMVAMLASQFGPVGLNMAYAAAGTFVAVETVANLTAGADTQTNADATPTPNVVAGADTQTNTGATPTPNVVAGADTQTNTGATPTPNVVAFSATGASTGVHGSTVTAVTSGTGANGINIVITDDDTTDCLGVTLA